MKTIDKKQCGRCHQAAEYEPIPFGEWDLGSGLPFYCAACAEAIEEEELSAARARIREGRELVWRETIPAKYRETDVEFPSFNRQLWGKLKGVDLHRSLALIGPSGRSKTRVFALLARRAIAQDFLVGWCPANSFQWSAQRQFDDREGVQARDWMRRWTEARVLFLDDLGKHRWTDTVESAFFNLIESRSSNNLPTHWSMNPDPADIITPATIQADAGGILTRALDPTGAASARSRFAPILSRLLDNTTLIAVS